MRLTLVVPVPSPVPSVNQRRHDPANDDGNDEKAEGFQPVLYASRRAQTLHSARSITPAVVAWRVRTWGRPAPDNAGQKGSGSRPPASGLLP
jgi:hypothetical protein